MKKFVFLFYILQFVIWADSSLIETESHVPESLGLAHEAFLDGDFAKSVGYIRDLLESSGSNSYFKHNALQLFVKIQYLLEKRSLEVDYIFPSQIKNPVFKIQRTATSDSLEHFIEFSGLLLKDVKLVQFRVSDPNGVPVLGLQEGLGSYVEFSGLGDANNHYRSFHLERSISNELDQGLYKFLIELSNGNGVEGWFILTNHQGEQAEIFDRSTMVHTNTDPDGKMAKLYEEAMRKRILQFGSRSMETPFDSGTTRNTHRVIRLNHRNRYMFGNLKIVSETVAEASID